MKIRIYATSSVSVRAEQKRHDLRMLRIMTPEQPGQSTEVSCRNVGQKEKTERNMCFFSRLPAEEKRRVRSADMFCIWFGRVEILFTPQSIHSFHLECNRKEASYQKHPRDHQASQRNDCSQHISTWLGIQFWCAHETHDNVF